MTKKPVYEEIRQIPFYQLVAMPSDELIELEKTISIELKLNKWIVEQSTKSVQRAKLALRWIQGARASKYRRQRYGEKNFFYSLPS